MTSLPLRRVGDIAPATVELEGEKLSVRQLEGKEFVIKSIRELHGENGPYLAVQIAVDDKPLFFFTGHKVIMQKLLLCIDAVPLLATIRLVQSKDGSNEYFDVE